MGTLSRNAGTKTSKEVEIINKLGLHARPCAKFVKLANTFRADVWVGKDDDTVNGKSIMGLMMLAAGHGTKLRISAAGGDAEKFLEEIEELVAKRFHED